MSDLVDKLWPSFEAEVSEQLEAIELALISIDSHAVDVDALFRQFHTIKGGCAMMGFHGMEAIAHAAEDVLVPVRKGTQALDAPRIEALLAALDGLKQQMDSAQQTRQSPAAMPSIVAGLKALSITPTQTAASEPVATTAQAGLRAQELDAFAVTCRDVLPALVIGALADPSAAESSLLALQHAALNADVGAIASMLSRPAAASDAAQERRHLYAQLLDRLAFLESRYDIDCGVTDTYMALRMQPPAELQAILAPGANMSALAAASPSARDSAITTAIGVCNALMDEAMLRGWPQTIALLRLARQTLREMRRRVLDIHDDLYQMLEISLTICQELEPSQPEPEAYVALVHQCHQRLQELALTLDCHQDREDNASLASQLGVEPQWLASLSDNVIRRVRQAVTAGECLALIDADLEGMADNGEGLVDWLSRQHALVHSDTLFGDKSEQNTRLRLLIALPGTREAFQQAIEEFDTDGRHLHVTLLGHAAPAGTPVPSTARSQQAIRQTTTLRVDSKALDQFVNRVGETVMVRNLLAHLVNDDALSQRRRRAQNLLSQRSSKRPMSDQELDDLREMIKLIEQRELLLAQADQRLQATLERMQDDALALRVVPIDMVFNRLPRVVRDVSQAQGKQVVLRMSGEDVRIDKSLLEILIEPLMHMVRNAVDHGIESPEQRRQAGKPEVSELALSARQTGNSLILEMCDDGRGLDLDKIRKRALENGLVSASALDAMDERALYNLIFLPGFSTSEAVTELSGRGVGMDVVRTRVLQVGGQVEVSSSAGAGTRFTLKLPLSAAIQNVILVACGGHRVALPERNVTEIINVDVRALQHIQGQTCMLLRETTLPVYRLDLLLGYPTADNQLSRAQLEVAVIDDGMHRIGLIVDQILGRPEIFVRDVHPDISALAGVGGVSVLADGGLVVIADCEKLFDLALRRAQSLRSLVTAP